MFVCVCVCVCVCVRVHIPLTRIQTRQCAGGGRTHTNTRTHTHTAQEPSFLMFLPGRRKVMKANLATLDTSLSVHTTPIAARKRPDPREHQNSRTHDAMQANACAHSCIHTRARARAQIIGARSWRSMIAHAPGSAAATHEQKRRDTWGIAGRSPPLAMKLSASDCGRPPAIFKVNAPELHNPNAPNTLGTMHNYCIVQYFYHCRK